MLRGQLEYLRDASRQASLTLQVTPFPVTSYAAPGSFSILRFADADMPDMVYAEQLTSATYVDKRAEVERYLLAMERLSIVSASPSDSVDLITGILSDLNQTA